MIGTIGGGEPIDLYRLTVNAATAGFQFQLSSPSAATASPRFWLFDGSGRVMGEWPSSTGERLTHHFRTRQFLLRLDTVSRSLARQSQWPTRFGRAARLSVVGATVQCADRPGDCNRRWRDSPFDREHAPRGSIVAPLSTLNAAPSRGNTSGLSTPAPAPNDVTAGFRVSVGSMPTRLNPAGGRPDVRGRSQFRRDPYLPGADREPTDRLLAASVQDRHTEPDSSNRPDGSQTHGGLIALRGPGGFPLLGADAIGSWRGARTRPSRPGAVSALTAC